MKRNKQIFQSHMTDFLFIITLFGVFTVSALFAVVIGANVYRSTTQQMDANYSKRTATAYITEKVRQHDTTDSMEIQTIDGICCLIFHETFNDEAYSTYIYADDGYLKESFVKDTLGFSSDYGENILEIRDFSIASVSDNTLSMSITDINGNTTHAYITVRSQVNGGEQP